MFPTHPDTIGVVNTLDYQERLRDAANARLAASAQVGERSPRTGLRTAPLVVPSWIGGILPRLRGAKQAPVAPPLISS